MESRHVLPPRISTPPVLGPISEPRKVIPPTALGQELASCDIEDVTKVLDKYGRTSPLPSFFKKG